MKYSMMTHSVSQQVKPGERVDMQAICDLTVQMGLDAMDQVKLYGYDPADIRKMAHDRGIRVICYTQPVDFGVPAGPDRDAAMADFRQVLETAQTLGAPMVMAPIPNKQQLPRDEARGYAIECLAEAAPLARAAGITLTTEHFPLRFAPFITSDDLEPALQAAPDLRVTMDTGNMLTGGEDPLRAYARHRDKIVFTHFKDWKIVEPGQGMQCLDGRWYQGELIHEGILDYPAIVAAMLAAEYDGYINLEYEGKDIPAFEALPRALAHLRELESQLPAGA